MRIRRGPLFWGLLLIPLGGIPLLVRVGALDGAVFVDAWRLWPLVLVGLGLAILLGRGRAGLALIVVLALGLGVVGGGALASGNLWLANVADCTATQASMDRMTDGGSFDTPASVRLELDCGDATVVTAAGATWSLGADYHGAPPTVTATSSSLRVASPERDWPHRQVWTLGLPASSIRDVSVTANAASATFDFEGTKLERFRADVNAGDLRIDGGGASIARLEVSMNAGRARVTLGTGATSGSLSANAGVIELCVPPTAGLALRVTDQLTFSHNLEQRGLSRSGDIWTRAGGGGVIELSIDGNATSFRLDPDGGC